MHWTAALSSNDFRVVGALAAGLVDVALYLLLSLVLPSTVAEGMSLSIGLSSTYLLLEWIVARHPEADRRQFEIVTSVYVGHFVLAMVWTGAVLAPVIGDGGWARVEALLLLSPVGAALIILAPRLHFSLDDVRRMSRRPAGD